MDFPILNISLHRFAAIVLGLVGAAMELFLLGAAYTGTHGFRDDLTVAVGFGFLVIAVGGSILVVLPFLFKGRDWARRILALQFVLMALLAVILQVGSIIVARDARSSLMTSLTLGTILDVFCAASFVFLISKPLVIELNNSHNNSPDPAGEPAAH